MTTMRKLFLMVAAGLLFAAVGIGLAADGGFNGRDDDDQDRDGNGGRGAADATGIRRDARVEIDVLAGAVLVEPVGRSVRAGAHRADGSRVSRSNSRGCLHPPCGLNAVCFLDKSTTTEHTDTNGFHRQAHEFGARRIRSAISMKARALMSAPLVAGEITVPSRLFP